MSAVSISVSKTYFIGHGDTQGILPGFDDAFCQSTAEKAVFVHDFLGSLEIKRYYQIDENVATISLVYDPVCNTFTDKIYI